MASTVTKYNNEIVASSENGNVDGKNRAPATAAGNRRTLKVIQEKASKPVHSSKQVQVSSTGTSNLTGRVDGGFSKLSRGEKPNKKVGENGFSIYKDTSPDNQTDSSKNAKNSCHTQTNLTGQNLIDLKEALTPDGEYYKSLAEERGERLNESLKQCEELWIEKEEVKEALVERDEVMAEKDLKIASLEEKIASLEETVEKANKIVEMIEPYLTEENETKDEVYVFKGSGDNEANDEVKTEKT